VAGAGRVGVGSDVGTGGAALDGSAGGRRLLTGASHRVVDRASGPYTVGDRPRGSPMGTTDQHSEVAVPVISAMTVPATSLPPRGVEPAGVKLADGPAAGTGDVYSARCDG